MKTNLKDNIWIEGFDAQNHITDSWDNHKWSDLIYHGKTSEIPEEIARNCAGFYCDDIRPKPGDFELWKDYSSTPDKKVDFYYVETAKESIQSACDKTHCIIYKTE